MWDSLRLAPINIHDFFPQKRSYMCAHSGTAHAVFRLTQLVHQFHVIKLSHTATTTTGYCTTGKCIASLLAFINLFIACDAKKALKWGGSVPTLWKVGGHEPPCPPSLTPLALANKVQVPCTQWYPLHNMAILFNNRPHIISSGTPVGTKFTATYVRMVVE